METCPGTGEVFLEAVDEKVAILIEEKTQMV